MEPAQAIRAPAMGASAAMKPTFSRVFLAVAIMSSGTVSSSNTAAALDVLAFGDSLTAGVGDESGDGYPKRLEEKLGGDSTVTNHGVPAEVTSEGLSRLEGVLAFGGDVLLLMEGTNDITKVAAGELSVETTLANIDTMIARTREAGIEPVLSSVIPRRPDAKRDRSNQLTGFYVGELRALAFTRETRFADAFDLFDPQLDPEAFDSYYSQDPDDVVGHLDADGYDRLATAYADLLTGSDTAAPVVGNFEPGTLPNLVPPNVRIRIPVYDFTGASGLDLAQTKLLINGKVVTDGLDSEGSEEGVELTHRGRKALGCRAVLRVLAQDQASPPNTLDRTIAIYGITGRNLLPGDVDFDCRVDGIDLVGLARRLGMDSTNPLYQLPFDLNRDGVIDAADLELFQVHFGKTSS